LELFSSGGLHQPNRMQSRGTLDPERDVKCPRSKKCGSGGLDPSHISSTTEARAVKSFLVVSRTRLEYD
jgi:hypothetical protein